MMAGNQYEAWVLSRLQDCTCRIAVRTAIHDPDGLHKEIREACRSLRSKGYIKQYNRIYASPGWHSKHIVYERV